MPESQDAEQNLLRDIYELVLAYEKGNWENIALYNEKLNLVEENVPRLYSMSIKWASSIFKTTGTA